MISNTELDRLEEWALEGPGRTNPLAQTILQLVDDIRELKRRLELCYGP